MTDENEREGEPVVIDTCYKFQGSKHIGDGLYRDLVESLQVLGYDPDQLTAMGDQVQIKIPRVSAEDFVQMMRSIIAKASEMGEIQPKGSNIGEVFIYQGEEGDLRFGGGYLLLYILRDPTEDEVNLLRKSWKDRSIERDRGGKDSLTKALCSVADYMEEDPQLAYETLSSLYNRAAQLTGNKE